MQKWTQTDTGLLRPAKFLTIIFVLIRLFQSNSEAATTGAITLSGVVPASTAVVVTPVAPYNNLTLSTLQTNLLVATVNEQNNTTLGYNLTLSSANAGKLKNGVVGQITYTARYNSVAVTLAVAPVNITTQGSQIAVVNVNKNFDISYAATPTASSMAGTYTDTLTFTIIAN